MTDVLNDKQKGEIAGFSRPSASVRRSISPSGCLFLASSEGGYITGQKLHINGGMAMD